MNKVEILEYLQNEQWSYFSNDGVPYKTLFVEERDLLINYIKQLQNQVEKLTQENNDLEERVIHQDNLIKQLRGNCKDLGKKNEKQREELNRLLKQREKFKTKHYYLKAEKEHLQSVIDKAIEYITSYDFEYLHEQMEHTLVDVLEVLLEILRSKE